MHFHSELYLPLAPTELALVRLAAVVAQGGDDRLAKGIAAVNAAATPPEWVDELILQALVVVGFPRTLVAMRAWRKAGGSADGRTDAQAHGRSDAQTQGRRDAEDPGLNYDRHPEWTAAGERTCHVVYGANYERLRQAVRELHPALDAWMITEGYGRTLSRPGLTLRQRELCMVAMVATLDTPHQLHSHLRGAVNAGATRDEVSAVIDAVLPELSSEAARTAREMRARVGG